MTSPVKLLRSHNLHPNKLLGQNFLKDPSTAEMIISRAGILPQDVIVEIGAGLGALTIPAARMAKKVYAIEKDRLIIPILSNEVGHYNADRVVVINKNILNIDLYEIAKTEGCQIIVMGNLPHNISTQILVQLITCRTVIKRCILMFQNELVRRMISPPGSREYGRLSVMVQYCADIKKIAEVKSSLFFPRPKVDSAVVELLFRKTFDFTVLNEAFLFKVIKSAFSKRRKMLKNTLAASELSIDIKTSIEVLEKSGIDPSRRAETLSIAEFVKLSHILYEKTERL